MEVASNKDTQIEGATNGGFPFRSQETKDEERTPMAFGVRFVASLVGLHPVEVWMLLRPQEPQTCMFALVGYQGKPRF